MRTIVGFCERLISKAIRGMGAKGVGDPCERSDCLKLRPAKTLYSVVKLYAMLLATILGIIRRPIGVPMQTWHYRAIRGILATRKENDYAIIALP